MPDRCHLKSYNSNTGGTRAKRVHISKEIFKKQTNFIHYPSSSHFLTCLKLPKKVPACRAMMPHLSCGIFLKWCVKAHSYRNIHSFQFLSFTRFAKTTADHYVLVERVLQVWGKTRWCPEWGINVLPPQQEHWLTLRTSSLRLCRSLYGPRPQCFKQLSSSGWTHLGETEVLVPGELHGAGCSVSRHVGSGVSVALGLGGVRWSSQGWILRRYGPVLGHRVGSALGKGLLAGLGLLWRRPALGVLLGNELEQSRGHCGTNVIRQSVLGGGEWRGWRSSLWVYQVRNIHFPQCIICERKTEDCQAMPQVYQGHQYADTHTHPTMQ